MKWLAEKQIPALLLVGNDRNEATRIAKSFDRHKIEIEFAENAEEALRMHRERSYRIVVCDWTLSGREAIELCPQLRVGCDHYVYFILRTSVDHTTDCLAALDSGVDDFISSSATVEEFEARIMVATRICHEREILAEKTTQLEHVSESLTVMNQSLGAASRRFEEMFSGLPVACFTFDQFGRIQEWNRSASGVFGIEAFEALECDVCEIFGPHERDVWNGDVIASLFAGNPIQSFDWDFVRSDGVIRSLAGSIICLRNASGAPVAAVCANLDISERNAALQRVEEYASQLTMQKLELESMNQRLSHLAVTDGLTGLWNHRRFQEMLDESVRTFAVRGAPFSLLLFDVDHFKSYNDEFGHQVGDHVLRQFSEVLKSTSRVGELPARYGGEEFAVLLHCCGRKEAMAVAERFQNAIREQRWRHRPVTSSVGVATFSEADLSGPELVRRADTALYASKQAGRNCCTHWEEIRTAETVAA
jgi:two-component system cell cycle response regulator